MQLPLLLFSGRAWPLQVAQADWELAMHAELFRHPELPLAQEELQRLASLRTNMHPRTPSTGKHRGPARRTLDTFPCKGAQP